MNGYSKALKFVHITTALLIFTLIIIGLYMRGVEDVQLMMFLYETHKSLGMLVLAAFMIRIIVRLKSKNIPDNSEHTGIEKALSWFTKRIFYILLLLVPVSGWLMSNAAGFTVSFFGLFDFPLFINENEFTLSIFQDIHFYSVFIFYIFITLHITGAVKHHFYDNDATLKNMFSDKIGNLGGILIMIPCVLFLTGSAYLWITSTADSNTSHEAAHDTVNTTSQIKSEEH